MKLGILTYQWANNYGAVIQCDCLARAVVNHNHEAGIINYIPPGNGLHWWQGWGLHKGTPSLSLKRLRFERFRKERLHLTRACRTVQQLRVMASELDGIIVGSDQVWNGHIVTAAELPYFLGFADRERCRLISYAATFGERNQPAHTRNGAGDLLKRFHAISVRDELSAELVRELSGRDADIVVDPTLLGSGLAYQNSPVTEDSYIAVYFISTVHVGAGRIVVGEVRRSLGLPTITVGQPRTFLNTDDDALSAGPYEWLEYLRRAAFICTDSFHGAALAIQYRKPFIAWPGIRSGRVRSLLSKCGIENRLIEAGATAPIEQLVGSPIDYDSVLEQLRPSVKASQLFLERALS